MSPGRPESESHTISSGALARIFIESFCSGAVKPLADTLSEGVEVKGPLLQCQGRDAYLQALRGQLDPDTGAEILSLLENGEEAMALYRYHGRDVAQWFRCRHGQIDKMRIVFDARAVN